MRRPEKKTLITAGVMFVAILIMTWVLRIPLGIQRNGENAGVFIHAGDIGVYLAAVLLGGPWGAIVAALGCCLADIFVGSAIYAIPTLIIKAGMVFLLAYFMKKDHSWLGILRTVGYAGGLMVIGYFLYDLVILGDYEVAALSLPFNLLQMIFSGLIAWPVLKILSGKSYQQADDPIITTTKRVK